MATVRVLRNAHNILGLSPGVSLSEIKKRANHLINLSRIEETEEYDTDLLEVKSLRNEENLRKSLEQLSSIKSRLIESFFWFELPTLQDRIFLKDLSNGAFQSAIEYWKLQSYNSPNWLAKKNEALAQFVSSYHTGCLSSFKSSLEKWQEIERSDSFWSFYQAHYKMTDDLGTDSSTFVELRAKLQKYLSWLALDVFRKHQDKEIVKIFFITTGGIGQGIEEHILNKKLRDLSQEITDFYSTDLNEIRIRTNLTSLQSKIDDLTGYGINEYSPVKAIRESAATKLRSFSIKLQNERKELKLAKDLLEYAAQISSSESFLLQYKKDKYIIQENNFINDFIEMSKNMGPSQKWQTFNNMASKLPIEMRNSDGFLIIKGDLLIGYTSDLFALGKHALFKNKNENHAESYMRTVFDELMSEIKIFNLNQQAVNSFIDDLVYRASNISSPDKISQIDDLLEYVRTCSNKLNADEESKLALFILGQAAILKEAAPYIKRVRYGSYLITLGWITIWFYFIGVAFWIAAYLYNRKVF